MSVKGGDTASLRAAIGTMSILDISSDGSGFLLQQSDLNDETQRGTIWTMPVLGGAAKRLGNISARGASYSPDGKLIAFNEKESVYVCDTDGQNVKELWNTHHMVPSNPVFSPDSNTRPGDSVGLKWCFKVSSSFPNLSRGLSQCRTQRATRFA